MDKCSKSCVEHQEQHDGVLSSFFINDTAIMHSLPSHLIERLLYKVDAFETDSADCDIVDWDPVKRRNQVSDGPIMKEVPYDARRRETPLRT